MDFFFLQMEKKILMWAMHTFLWCSLHISFPDISIIEKETTASVNQTFGSFIFKGANNGKFINNLAIGKEVSAEGFFLLTFNDQSIATSEQVYFDRMTWFLQMG